MSKTNWRDSDFTQIYSDNLSPLEPLEPTRQKYEYKKFVTKRRQSPEKPGLVHTATLSKAVHPSKGLIQNMKLKLLKSEHMSKQHLFTDRSINTIKLFQLPRITKLLAIFASVPSVYKVSILHSRINPQKLFANLKERCDKKFKTNLKWSLSTAINLLANCLPFGPIWFSSFSA